MIGEVIGNYRVTRKLGQGGMGAVYEARNDAVGRRAAIKVLLAEMSTSSDVAERFRNEAKAASQIEHPGIVTVFDVGRLADGSSYIIMDFLDGESLRQRLERIGALPTAGKVLHDHIRLFQQIASALAAAHAKKVIHRDLKPDNVMIVADPDMPSGERPKIVDFGIAKLVDHKSVAAQTSAGSMLGTPIYMAPEQFVDAAGVTDKADVYSFGVMLHHALSGKPPFLADSLYQLMSAHVGTPPPSLEEVAPGYAGLVADMLAKKPAERPTMKQVADRLEQALVPPAGVLAVTLPLESTPGASNGVLAEARPLEAPAPATGVLAETRPLEAPAPETGALADTRPLKTPPSPPSRSSRVPIAIAASAAVVAGAIIVFVATRPGSAPADEPPRDAGRAAAVDAPTAAPPSSHPSTGKPDPDMLAFAATTFQMGSTPEAIQREIAACKGDACDRQLFEREAPVRRVTLSPFELDRREVTVADFAAWLARQPELRVAPDSFVYAGSQILVDPTTAALIGGPGTFAAAAGAERRPIRSVSWEAAVRYCRDRGKRLPTEAEWERAARGDSGRRFPWGAEMSSCKGVVFGRTPALECAAEGNTPLEVGSAPGDVTPDGIHDLGGNVSEWVADAYAAPYPSCGDCKDPRVDQGELRVYRGANYMFSASTLHAASRSKRQGNKIEPNIGFRCARSSQEKP